MMASPLALHMQQETQRWDLIRRQRLDVLSLDNDSSQYESTNEADADDEDDDLASISTSLTSIEAEDEDELPQPPPMPQDTDGGTPIPVYGSLGEAAQHSIVDVAEPRRLVTPGKLYENEEDDDEIFEYDDASSCYEHGGCEQMMTCGGVGVGVGGCGLAAT